MRAGRLSRSAIANLPTGSAPPLTEAQFQRQITEYAEMCGWSWAHFRPAVTSKGWRTPVSGPLGAGFPDLILVRGDDRRLLFVEVKREGAKPTMAQVAVMDLLAQLDWHQWDTPGIGWVLPRIEVHLWHPRDWDFIEAELR